MDNKHYGLIGAHRVGKTTSAQKFAVSPHIAYLQIDTNAIFVELGFNPKDQYDIETRLTIQEQLIERVEPQYRDNSCSITDRTPIDFLIYMLADVTRDFPSRLEERFAAYQKRCIDMYFQYFQRGCVIQPGIPIIDVAKSAPPSVAYIAHLNHIAVGLANALNIDVMPIHILDLEERDEYLTAIFLPY
jgi:hypothetical protein